MEYRLEPKNIVKNWMEKIALVLNSTGSNSTPLFAKPEVMQASRPYVVRLLEKGEIPFSKVGTHRRIKVSDLVAYQKKMKASRKKQLNYLAKQAQELDLEYSNE